MFSSFKNLEVIFNEFYWKQRRSGTQALKGLRIWIRYYLYKTIPVGKIAEKEVCRRVYFWQHGPVFWTPSDCFFLAIFSTGIYHDILRCEICIVYYSRFPWSCYNGVYSNSQKIICCIVCLHMSGLFLSNTYEIT